MVTLKSIEIIKNNALGVTQPDEKSTPITIFLFSHQDNFKNIILVNYIIFKYIKNKTINVNLRNS